MTRALNKRSHVRDFTTGNITQQLIVFALPLFLSNLLQVVYNMVDMIVVGRTLGEVGLSAVSLGGDVSHFIGLDMGAGGAALATVISQGTSFLCCAVFLFRRQENPVFQNVCQFLDQFLRCGGVRLCGNCE